MMREKVVVLIATMVCGYLGYLGALSMRDGSGNAPQYVQTVIE